MVCRFAVAQAQCKLKVRPITCLAAAQGHYSGKTEPILYSNYGSGKLTPRFHTLCKTRALSGPREKLVLLLQGEEWEAF